MHHFFGFLVWLCLSIFSPTSGLAAPADDAIQAFQKDDYYNAAAIGSVALAQSPQNHALRLVVANSLSWTGRYEAAIAQYEMLFGTDLEAAGRVGIGNIFRWRGMIPAAAAMHERAVSLAPQSKDAAIALALTARELRPATTLRLLHFDDNLKYERNELQFSQRL